MRVSDSANPRKRFIKDKVSRKVRRRPQVPLDDLAFEVHDDEIFRLHRLVGNATRLDDYEALVPGNAARVSEGVKHQPAADKFEIGVEYFLAKSS
jgi:hypothetical protein